MSGALKWSPFESARWPTPTTGRAGTRRGFAGAIGRVFEPSNGGPAHNEEVRVEDVVSRSTSTRRHSWSGPKCPARTRTVTSRCPWPEACCISAPDAGNPMALRRERPSFRVAVPPLRPQPAVAGRGYGHRYQGVLQGRRARSQNAASRGTVSGCAGEAAPDQPRIAADPSANRLINQPGDRERGNKTYGTGPSMELKSQWHRLDPATRRWFMDNPGCVVLPRTIATIVARVADEPVVRDQHGAIQLSAEDVSFIRTRVHSSAAAAGEHKFFDSVQPGQAWIRRRTWTPRRSPSGVRPPGLTAAGLRLRAGYARCCWANASELRRRSGTYAGFFGCGVRPVGAGRGGSFGPCLFCPAGAAEVLAVAPDADAHHNGGQCQ